MTQTVRRMAGTPLSEEALEQLRQLADLPDEEIDFSDIPERTSAGQPSTRRRQQAKSDTALEKAS